MIRQEDDTIWTPKIVGTMLVEAVKWAQFSAGRVGPAGERSNLPDIAMFASDREEEKWPSVDELEPPKERRRAYSPQKVSEMERVLWWPGRYLAGKTHDGPARVLKVWVRCRVVRGMSFDKACKRRGWSRATAYRAVDKALAAIAIGLTRDGIKRGGK